MKGGIFMQSNVSGDYISNRAWLRDVVSDSNLILRGVSALEYLEYFVGYSGEFEIDVYAKTKGVYSNINYRIVEAFDNIDYITHGKVLCTSFSQAVNDLLEEKNSDEQALSEALSNYYFSHDKSFDGLFIKEYNLKRFNSLKEFAINYYSGG